MVARLSVLGAFSTRLHPTTSLLGSVDAPRGMRALYKGQASQGPAESRPAADPSLLPAESQSAQMSRALSAQRQGLWPQGVTA